MTRMLTPFPMLLKSQLQTRKKIIILGLFSLGTFITIIQIIRILTIKSLSNAIDSSHLLIRSIREKSSANRSKRGTGTRGTPYALQTIGSSNRDRDGHMILGSGNDIDGKDHSSVVVSGGHMDNSSEEFIFPRSDHRIYQKTEVTITKE